MPYADELVTQGPAMCKFDWGSSHSLRKINIMRIILMVTPLHENAFRVNVLIASMKTFCTNIGVAGEKRCHKTHVTLCQPYAMNFSCNRGDDFLLDFSADIVAPIWFWSMMTSSNENIFRVTGHLCGEFTGLRWIPRTKVSDAELWCFLWSASE